MRLPTMWLGIFIGGSVIPVLRSISDFHTDFGAWRKQFPYHLPHDVPRQGCHPHRYLPHLHHLLAPSHLRDCLPPHRCRRRSLRLLQTGRHLAPPQTHRWCHRFRLLERQGMVRSHHDVVCRYLGHHGNLVLNGQVRWSEGPSHDGLREEHDCVLR